MAALGVLGAIIALLPAGGDVDDADADGHAERTNANDRGSRSGASSAVGRDAAHQLELHDLVMALLLVAIALRSAAWTALQFVWAGQHSALLALALAAALGKALGGVASDAFGWRRWTLGALTSAAALLTLADGRLLLLAPGVALLQSATPAMWLAVADRLPGRPATASGLVLGGAIALGGAPLWMGLPPAFGPALALGGAGALLAAGLALRRAAIRR